METTVKVSINTLGDQTGRNYTGTFTFRTVLTRGERFVSDQRRREILGPNSEQAMSDLQLEAFMLGQLFVRVVESPEWWSKSNGGLNLEDGNVISELFNVAMSKEKEYKEELQKQAEAALKQMSKK